MAYTFDTSITENCYTAATVQPFKTNWANAATIPDPAPSNPCSDLNESLWIDGYQAYGQIMDDDSFHNLLQILHGALTPILGVINSAVKLDLHLAIDNPGRFRPFIGVSAGSDPTKYYNFGTNLAQGGTRSSITASTASGFESGLESVEKNDLYKEFSFVPTGGSRTFVTQNTFSHEDTKAIHDLAMASSYGNVKLYLFFGAGAEQTGDPVGTHPMNFRPILDLKVTGESPYYWDFSSPCPPNCSSE